MISPGDQQGDGAPTAWQRGSHQRPRPCGSDAQDAAEWSIVYELAAGTF